MITVAYIASLDPREQGGDHMYSSSCGANQLKENVDLSSMSTSGSYLSSPNNGLLCFLIISVFKYVQLRLIVKLILSVLHKCTLNLKRQSKGTL